MLTQTEVLYLVILCMACGCDIRRDIWYVRREVLYEICNLFVAPAEQALV